MLSRAPLSQRAAPVPHGRRADRTKPSRSQPLGCISRPPGARRMHDTSRSQKPTKLSAPANLGFNRSSMETVRLRSGASTPPTSAAGDAPLEPAAKAGLLFALLLSVATASMAAFAFGYNLGVVNGPLQAISASLGFGGNASLEGLVVSSLLAGAAAGSMGGSALADTLGRRKGFLLTAVPLVLGPVLSASAGSLSAMLAGRVLAGIGIGLSSALVPIYISEISPTHLRGTLGSVNQLLICVGILAALVVNVLLPATTWRTMFWIAAAPATLLALGMLLCPESPRWLASHGKRKEAQEAGERLWGAAVVDELGDEKAVVGGAGSAKAEASWGEALASKPALVGCALFVLQQFSGINAIVYFSSSVFKLAGIQSGALASAAVGACNVLGTVVAAGLMDRAGRKQLMSISFSGMGAAMLAMAAGMWLPALAGAAGAIALLGTLAYILFFAVGAGPVPALLIPEINSARLRGRAMSLAMTTHWVCNWLLGQFFLGAVAAFGVPAIYLFFGTVCFVTVGFVSRNVVETKGRSLEEIEKDLAAV